MVEVKLHDIGEGMTEASVAHYFIKKGDFVKADDPLVEVQTDKMSAEIPAPISGIVSDIQVNIGDTIPVGTTLLLIKSNDDTISKEKAIHLSTEPIQKPLTSKRQIMATPFTRKIAREHNVNIESISGTGPFGRVLDEDVYAYIENIQQHILQTDDNQGSKLQTLTHNTSSMSEATFAERRYISTEKQQEPNEMVLKTDKPVESSQTTIPFQGRRKQIARKMVQSLRTMAICTHFEEVDVTDLMTFRGQLKELDKSISATAIFIKAVSLSLKKYPIFNARLDEENEVIQLIEEHHIGIATNTDNGLIVPVIKNVESKSIFSIHQEMKELTKKAVSHQLAIQELTGSTFTISNVGPLGGSIGATPIMNSPEVGILSFHKTKKRPVVNEKDEIVIRSIMNISMSFDHRVVDGATAVEFTNYFSKLIEYPNLMLLEMV